MALKFGELWGEVRVDDSKMKPDVARAVDQGKREMDGLEEHGGVVGRQTGEQVGDGIGEGMDGVGDEMSGAMDAAGPMLMAGIAGLAAVGGALFATAFSNAMDMEKGTDRLAAQLGLTEDQSRIAGGVAGRLFKDSYGESLDDVSDAVSAVGSTLTDVTAKNQDDLERLTTKALNLSSTFDVDVDQAVNTAGIAIRQGLAGDADEAFDLITAAMQRMPAGMRDELFPTIDEYGDELVAMGFTGSDAFGMLVEASQGGQFQLDKTGDAIKELGIRSTDMSATSVQAYQTAGLNAEDMAARFLAGGDTAKGALDDLIDGLLGIEDPTARANAAIALFGTPIEDLGVTKIPGFLSSLKGVEGGMGDVKGAADKMGETLNENTATDAEALKRSLSVTASEGINRLLADTKNFGRNTSDVWDEVTRQWRDGGDTMNGA